MEYDEGFMTVAQAAEYLALGQSTIWQLMYRGRLPYTKIGRARRIPRAAIKSIALNGLTTGR